MDDNSMNGNELIKRLKELAKQRGCEIRLDSKHGKGSHATLYFGDRRTTIKDRKKEIGPGLLKSMLDDLGLSKKDINQ